jgi:hypothetical protein
MGNKMGDAMGKRIGLARAGPGNDEKRLGGRVADTVDDGRTLVGVEPIEIGCVGRHESVLRG